MVSPLTTVWCGLLAALSIALSNGQQCSMITQSDLGSSAAPNTSGLISSALTIGVESAGNPLVQLFGYHIVCEAVAAIRGTYLYVSLIANYTINFEFRTAQFDFGCTERNEWDTLVDGSSIFIVTDPPDGSFNTVARSDCRACLSPRRLSGSDTETHCAPCPSECIGLRQCHTPSNLTCCDYYLNNMCVLNCPSNYIASSEFECICSAGFTGSDCTTEIDLCVSLPCMNSGSCTSMFGTSYVCQCPEEYTGENCETDVDECSIGDGPCENGGTCFNTAGSYRCTCVAEFTGQDCDHDVNECLGELNPCENSGTCSNTYGGFTCSCPPNYTGQLCTTDVDECSLDGGICANGGTCRNREGSYSCECIQAYTGMNCEEDVDECSAALTNPCVNGGICINSIGGFGCSCPVGFTGESCDSDIDECTSAINPCQNGGICTNMFGSFVCNCTDSVGFVGDLCNVDINECLTPDAACQNGGTCINALGTFTCRCPPGFMGPTCADDIDECLTISPALCRNGGSCTNTLGGFQCQCTSEFSGAMCKDDIDECAGISPCMHSGTCVNQFGGYTCHCGRNWNGQNCEECGISNCTGCFGSNAACSECQQGFVLSDRRCIKETICTPSCVGGTICINGQCNCRPGFIGTDCSDSCSSRIPRCVQCQANTAGEIFCTVCESGQELIDNECKPLCEDQFCIRCENSPLECSQCQTGYTLDVGADRTKCLYSASIVGAIIGAILLLGMIAFIISGIYKVKERPKMKKAPKTTIFDDYGEKSNPTYVPPEVAVKAIEFAEEEAEIELDEWHSIQREMSRNPLHTINAHNQ